MRLRREFLVGMALVVAAVGVSEAGHAAGPRAAVMISAKKGVGLTEKQGMKATHLAALNVSWYYNWGASTTVASPAQFVPMIYSLNTLTASTTGSYVLGFNEPDNANQSNIPVSQAIAAWPTVVAKAPLVGSPAMAGNPVTSSWLATFMTAKPKVDFITAHWYKGPNAKTFISDMQAIYKLYSKPIWVTEFAPQTGSSSRTSPTKYTQAEVNQFIATVVPWMESTTWLQRYAWHDSKVGTSALFDAAGALTPTGVAYAAAR